MDAGLFQKLYVPEGGKKKEEKMKMVLKLQ